MVVIERLFILATLSALLNGCASSAITRLTGNQAMITTRAAAVCGTTGAASVAERMAAVATIKQNYERFVVGGFGTENNTQLVTTGPTYANTNISMNQFGNTAYGSARTTFGGQMTYLRGSNDAQMRVIMLNPGDQGFEQGIDAKQVLGPEWRKLVDEGINHCF